MNNEISKFAGSHDFEVSQLKNRIIELENRLQEIQLQTHVLLDIARALNASLDVHVIATNIINAMVSLIAIDKASVCLHDEITQELRFIALFDSSTLSPRFPDDFDTSMLYDIFKAGQPYKSQSVSQNGWGCVSSFPLKTAQRKIGLINIHSIRQTELSVEQMEFLETVASHAASALENAILYGIVERESITDGLTGVYNYRYFQKRLREYLSLCQRSKGHRELGLLIIDVDYFKSFNDRFGHQFGDLVLKTVVQVLGLNLREEDILARYGGEEFALLVPEANQDVIFSISEKIRNIVEQTEIVYPQTGELVSITVSIGATLWDPDDSISSIIARADNALYQAKQLGRNQSVISIN